MFLENRKRIYYNSFVFFLVKCNLKKINEPQNRLFMCMLQLLRAASSRYFYNRAAKNYCRSLTKFNTADFQTWNIISAEKKLNKYSIKLKLIIILFLLLKLILNTLCKDLIVQLMKQPRSQSI